VGGIPGDHGESPPLPAWFRAHADLILQIRTTEDIRRAKREGRTGIVLGFQNVSAFEDQLGAIGLFKELGVGIVQLAYSTQNLVGAGCYASKDPGLSDFGREVVAEMNRVGMMCDLRHVGATTSTSRASGGMRSSSTSACRQQLAHPGLALGRHDAELGEMGAQRVDRRGALPHQLIAHPAPGSQRRPRWSARSGAQHTGRLLACALDRDEAHARPLHGFAAPFGVRPHRARWS
jgi:Membrane dipeptidase (Peptidase family M19)